MDNEYTKDFSFNIPKKWKHVDGLCEVLRDEANHQSVPRDEALLNYAAQTIQNLSDWLTSIVETVEILKGLRERDDELNPL